MRAMIECIVSSLGLYQCLKKLGDLQIDQVRLHNNNLTIDAGEKIIKMNVHFEESTAWFSQYHRNWDNLFKTLARIEEQPIILRIGDNKLEIVISF